MGRTVYDIVTERIIALLEAGACPWRKTWSVGGGMPTNLVTRKEYRGVNVFMLGCQNYSSQYWLTFKQCQDKGGHVRKGEKSTPVVFWKWVGRKDADDTDQEQTVSGKIPMLRYYNVFNLDQVEGITVPPAPETSANPFTPIGMAQEIIAGMPLRPDIRHGGNKACYSPMLDYVKLPKPTTDGYWFCNSG